MPSLLSLNIAIALDEYMEDSDVLQGNEFTKSLFYLLGILVCICKGALLLNTPFHLFPFSNAIF